MKNYTLPTIFFAVLFSVQSLFASSGQLESVSEEVLANNVFTKLDAKSLGAVTQTCNRFKNIVRDSPTLWKNRKVSLTKKNYPEILKAPYGFTVIHNCCPLVDYGFLDLEQLAEILTKYQSSI